MSDLNFRVESVELVNIGQPRSDGTKLLTLLVTKADDLKRVGALTTVPAPQAFDAGIGSVGTAIWLPGESLPKLMLGPRGGA